MGCYGPTLRKFKWKRFQCLISAIGKSPARGWNWLLTLCFEKNKNGYRTAYCLFVEKEIESIPIYQWTTLIDCFSASSAVSLHLVRITLWSRCINCISFHNLIDDSYWLVFARIFHTIFLLLFICVEFFFFENYVMHLMWDIEYKIPF